MSANTIPGLGDFTIFGITPTPETYILYRLSARLNVTPQIINYGSAGSLFFYTSYGEVAENEVAIVLKLGLTHSVQGTPLAARQLLDQGLISPQTIKADHLRGNALIACFSKKVPEFITYKTIMSVPQLYFSQAAGGILCTDGPRPHLALLDEVRINDEALVQYFLFRYVLGRLSYFDGINRLLCGEVLRWRNGQVETKLLRDLRSTSQSLHFQQADSQAMTTFANEMSRAMGAYIVDIKQAGQTVASTLSGGVDSTLMQLWINEHVPVGQRQSYSYVIDTPRFQYEVNYATEASQRLQTEHTFVLMKPEEYPRMLVETIDTLGFPIPAESYPNKMSIPKYVSAHGGKPRFFFMGNGADSLHGTTLARKIAMLEQMRQVPAGDLMLRVAAGLLNPFAAKKAHGLRAVAGMLAQIDNPHSYKIPANTTAVYTDIPTARRCFGDQALQRAFEYRRYIEDLYLGSNDQTEQVHMIELLTDAYECGVVTNHLNLAHCCEQIYFFMDEDVMRIGLAFDPRIRFLQGRKVKPILKGTLERTPLADITRKPKGTSVFNEDLHDWMRTGPMRELVLAIERPGFLNQKDFEKLLEVPAWNPLDEPNWFLWNLLNYDISQKQLGFAQTRQPILSRS